MWAYDNKGKKNRRDGPGANNTEFLKKVLISGTLTDKDGALPIYTDIYSLLPMYTDIFRCIVSEIRC